MLIFVNRKDPETYQHAQRLVAEADALGFSSRVVPQYSSSTEELLLLVKHRVVQTPTFVLLRTPETVAARLLHLPTTLASLDLAGLN